MAFECSAWRLNARRPRVALEGRVCTWIPCRAPVGARKGCSCIWVVCSAPVGLQLLILRAPLIHADRKAVLCQSLLSVGLNAESFAGLFDVMWSVCLQQKLGLCPQRAMDGRLTCFLGSFMVATELWQLKPG